ncbi:hypothetical protein HUN01_14330 [Nostoc edaphicum CCNP1411]|uniref:Uncharacterized protein n=1 Tax=Nostoc edaphicum CCNP1411 TaxID=1472755 RepID=A0A7D7LAQ1_9NOSO|nr:hypothetical protein [Nostoc edaphicum]QMS88716.1 hypothetical protein HUN01_14330 [Nostoc edaphicum CCNP1411]
MFETNNSNLKDTGLFQAYPIYIDKGLAATGMFLQLAPWGSATITGLRGKSIEDSVDQIIINYEWPIPLLHLDKQLSKEEQENLHLQRFLTDYSLATGKIEYTHIQLGNNPPDFSCNFKGVTVSLDCVQFTVSRRREVNALFENIRRKILDRPREKFLNLRGYLVYTWFGFGNSNSNNYPHRANDTEGIDQIIEMLGTVNVNPVCLQIPGGKLPSQAPNLGLVNTEKGCIFYVVPMSNGVPSTRFFQFTGFEIGLAYTSVHNREEGWAELHRLVKKHDKQEIEHLLITVGGPNKHGLVFPSDEILINFMLEGAKPKIETEYLEVVFIHLWSTGTIIKLVPEYQIITLGLFPGGIGMAFNNINIT